MIYALVQRSFVVGRFGLKTGGRYVASTPYAPIHCAPGDPIGFFRVFERTESEAILGEDDSHLDFRVSVLVEGTRVTVSTLVFYNNFFGRLYFAFVRPVHRLLVPWSLANDFSRYLA